MSLPGSQSKGAVMSDQVGKIKGIMDEHESIEQHIVQAIRSIEDWQISLESTLTSEGPLNVEGLSAKQSSLVHMIDSLEDGMLGHFGREEGELLEFVGPVISKALGIQHTELLARLRVVRNLLTETDLKSMSRADLAAKYPYVQKELEDTYRLIGDHGRAEDITLRLVLKGVIARG
jgi:hypothetical protein